MRGKAQQPRRRRRQRRRQRQQGVVPGGGSPQQRETAPAEMSLVAGALQSERAAATMQQQATGGAAQMPETVSRSEYTAMLARIDAKLDKLDSLATDMASLRSSLPTRTEFDAALALHVRSEVFLAEVKRIDDRWRDGMADIDTRFAKLEGSPQRNLAYVSAGLAILAVVISAFWVLLWVIEHAGTITTTGH